MRMGGVAAFDKVLQVGAIPTARITSPRIDPCISALTAGTKRFWLIGSSLISYYGNAHATPLEKPVEATLFSTSWQPPKSTQPWEERSVYCLALILRGHSEPGVWHSCQNLQKALCFLESLESGTTGALGANLGNPFLESGSLGVSFAGTLRPA